MDRRSILSKTGKGLIEATGKTSLLPRALRNVLTEVEGQISFAALAAKFDTVQEAALVEAINTLEKEGFVRVALRAAAAPAAGNASVGARRAAAGGEDLDFTSATGHPAPQDIDDA